MLVEGKTGHEVKAWMEKAVETDGPHTDRCWALEIKDRRSHSPSSSSCSCACLAEGHPQACGSFPSSGRAT